MGSSEGNFFHVYRGVDGFRLITGAAQVHFRGDLGFVYFIPENCVTERLRCSASDNIGQIKKLEGI